MGMKFTRRAALAGVISSLAAPALATAPTASLRPIPRPGSVGPAPAADLLAKAKLSGTTAFIATRADGTVIEALNAARGLPPASVAKALTAVYAMESLGASYRFATVLLGTGPVADGVLEGDLILKGTGDPILDSDALGGLAAQLKEAGITGISGRFLVDGRDMPKIDQVDPAQLPWVGYNPSVSGLNLNYNRVHFEWRKTGADYRLTMDARAKTYQPRVATSQMKIVPEAWPIYTYRQGADRELWTVARPALGSGGARWLPVRRPEIYAGDVFRTIAASFGVTLPEAEIEAGPMRGAVLGSHISPSLRGLCGGMLKYSTNLTAEVLGLRASQARGAAPETLQNSAEAMNSWAAQRFGAAMELVDHSGLGEASRVSCAGLARVLNGTSELSDMLKEIKVKNSQGDVVDAPSYGIRAKTGTLYFVNSLAGYITPKGREPISFAIISSDLPRRAAIKEGDKERPPGARSYARRARTLQQGLIARWAALAVEA
ncbi:MAG: D-alanyl-D-alanine carboxypeptidase/D-alanyl-D-alanine-endopeptidase [Pseudomonadota bacterium]